LWGKTQSYIAEAAGAPLTKATTAAVVVVVVVVAAAALLQATS
jgi:hypothetical protein